MPFVSEAYVKSVKLDGRTELIVRDTRLPGFGLRVRPKADGSLSKLFMVFWEEPPAADGSRKRRKASIGEWPIWTAEAARQEAQVMLQSAKRGEDPARIRQEKRAAPTWAELVKEFEHHLATKKATTAKSYRNLITRNLTPFFGRMKVKDVSAEDVRRFMRSKSDRPTDANRALATLSVMMGRAVELGWTAGNPCTGIKRNPENVRDRWLDESELPKFVAALAKRENIYAEAIRFAAVTGWRIGEVLGLTFEQVALHRAVAELGDTKTGKSVRALSADALSLIEAQPRRAGYVFSVTGSRKACYRKTLDELKAVCDEAEIEAITPHVLRHTAATWAAISGAEAHELREAFGWKTLAMTGRYVSKSESLGRRGVERAAQAMKILGENPAEAA